MTERASAEPGHVAPEPGLVAREAPPRGGSIVRRMQLGSVLRQLREEKGISAEDAAYAIRGSQSKISRMEAGRVGFKLRDVADLLTLYGVSDQEKRDSILAIAQETGMPPWWQQYSDIVPPHLYSYLGLEEAASLIRTFDVMVPELLQAEEYARALTRFVRPTASDEEVEGRVELQLRRQRLLDRPDGLKFWAVVDESALHRPIGDRKVMRAQLEHLIKMCELKSVSVQIMPFGFGAHAGLGGPFSILRFAAPELSDVVHIRHLTGALLLDREAEVEQYMLFMDKLSTDAISVHQSIGFLHDLAAKL